MKSNNLSIASYTCIVAIIFTFLGCRKMDDTYSGFLEKGETVYIAKADSLKARGGKNRIELSWLLLSDPKVTRYKVYWNNGRDSIENSVVKTTNVDTVKLMINDIAEGTHQFEIYTYDKVGNKSVKATKLGKVYANIYSSSLLSATYSKLERSGNDLRIIWNEPTKDLAGMDISYQNTSNVLKAVHTSEKAEATILANFPLGGEFSFITSFLPEPKALDTFKTSLSSVKLLLDSIKWNDYSQIFEHLDYIVANKGGALSHFFGNIQDGFSRATASGTGFSFPFLFSHNEGLVIQKTTGEMVRYPLSPTAVFGAAKSLGIDWTNSNLLFSNKGNIIARLSIGELWQRPLDNNGVWGTKIKINGTWSTYNGMWGTGDFLIARTSDGKLWSISLSAAGVAGTPAQIATGWDSFNLISSYNTGLMARKPNGELWYYPINTNGTLGIGKLIVISWEKI
jgi:hypothetical protein